jgi:hypothetical protein
MDPNLMDPTPVLPSARRRNRRRGLAALLLAMSLATVGAGAFSLAVFTDTKSVGANAFTAGTIVLGVNPASALLTASALMPGDNVNGTLVVSNTGTGQLRYAMTSSSTNTDNKGLAGQMTLVVKELGSGCSTFNGNTVYTGSLDGAAFGSSAQGAQTGDRTLNAGSSETLCFRASLPLSTDNTFQGATTTTTFTFNAEQTANN